MLWIKVSRGRSGRLTATTPNGHRSVTSWNDGKRRDENFSAAAQACIDKHRLLGRGLDLTDARLADGGHYVVFAFDSARDPFGYEYPSLSSG